MTDYISRQAAQNITTEWLSGYITDEQREVLEKVEMDLGELPSADVVEVDKVNKIYEKLADLLDAPCNYSPCDEIMLESGRCREDCGNISDAECWERYFDIVCDGEGVEA